MAQTFTTLYRFSELSGAPLTNSDGRRPWTGLIMSSNILFGTANQGGSFIYGTVFAVKTDGSEFRTLHSFTEPNSTNNDGAWPQSKLTIEGNILFGTAYGGGLGGWGTVFKVNTDGSGFTNLHSFAAGIDTNSDGFGPQSGLVLSGNILYGTASQGGSSGSGTIFAVNTNGTGFTVLYHFTKMSGSYPNLTNSDGALPASGLILSGDTLYGTAYQGGRFGNGTVFAINTNGIGFSNLYNFTKTFHSHPVAELEGD